MIRTFTAADIEKYHTGQLSATERHALEKAALDDPFLADALEGYANPGVNITGDIAELKKRLEERTEKNKVIPIAGRSSSIRWLRVAAMIVLVAGTGFFIYKLSFSDNHKSDIAQAPIPVAAEKKSTDTISADSELAKPKDSITGLDNTLNSVDGDGTYDNYNKMITESHKQTLPVQKLSDTLGVYYFTPSFESNTAQSKPAAPRLDDTVFKLKTLAPGAENRDREIVSNLHKPSAGITNEYKLDSNEFVNGYTAGNDKSAPFRGNAYKKLNKNNPVASTNNTNAALNLNERYRANVFSGRVTDANNNALPFANITNTADNVGTYSDVKGNFTLTSPDSVLNVQVRSVGFESNVTQLNATQRNNQVTLKEEDNSFAEVIVSNKRVRNTKARISGTTFEEPEPVDGWSNYDTYVANNLNMPDTLKGLQASAAREVEVSFDVNKDGAPVNISVDRSLCKSCDEEAIRLLKEGPKWKRKKKKRTSVTISF